MLNCARTLLATEGDDAKAGSLARVLQRARSDNLTVADKADEMVTLRGFNEAFKEEDFDGCFERLQHNPPEGDKPNYGIHMFPEAKAGDLQMSMVSQAISELALKETTDEHISCIARFVRAGVVSEAHSITSYYVFAMMLSICVRCRPFRFNCCRQQWSYSSESNKCR